MILNINEIQQYLPHRYPFLLVDRVLEVEKMQRCVALKNVTFNEPFFTGHFPSDPIMPGVLIIEAMAQVAGVLGFYSQDKKVGDGSMYLLVGTDNMRFRRPVVPGDQLTLEATYLSDRRGIWKFDCTASVGGEVAVSGTILCAHREA